MAAAQHRNALPAGFRVHWYEIERVLGQGGFGITYLARDTNLNQAVAIKEYLPIELAVRADDRTVQPVSEERGATFAWGLDRFLREGQTLAQFKHPNIVRVLSLFKGNNTGYMVMEYEQGVSLEALLRKRRTITEPELLQILFPLLDGVERVHEAGFVHRDIKPANVLIHDDGTPVLIDFGSARQAFAGYTRTLTTLVSPGYAPFEQYASKGEKQGPWTDIYALAATMYRAVSGKAPPDAIERSVVLQQEPDPLRPAAEIGKGRYSHRFLGAIDRGLAFLEKDRPQNVAQWRSLFSGPHESKAAARAEAATVPATDLVDTPPTLPLDQAIEKPLQASKPLSPRRGFKFWGVTALLVAGVGLVTYEFVVWRQGQPPVGVATEPVEHAPPALKTVPEMPKQVKVSPVAEQDQLRDQAVLERQAKISGLLAEAQDDIEALRLTSPAGNNALERYRAVLDLDPNNQEAQKGLRHIVDRYLELAASAQASQQLDKAEQYVQKAEAIQPDAQDVRRAREQLVARKAEFEAQTKVARTKRAGAAADKTRPDHIAEPPVRVVFTTALTEKNQPVNDLKQIPITEDKIYVFASWFGLTPGKQYTYRSEIFDGAGNLVRAAKQTFKPKHPTWNTWSWYSIEENIDQSGDWLFKLYLNEAVIERHLIVQSEKPATVSALTRKTPAETALTSNEKLTGSKAQELKAGLTAFKSADYAKALRLLKPLAEGGIPEAGFYMGLMHARGNGVGQNYSKAADWYQKAAAQGHALAQLSVAILYENGWGVTQDDVQAANWYHKAADQGQAKAQLSLGIMYENGWGVTQDYGKAVKWYRKAAQQGQAQAQFSLGMFYENGWGVTQNGKEALKWYRKAATEGNADATRALERLGEN